MSENTRTVGQGSAVLFGMAAMVFVGWIALILAIVALAS